MTDGPAPDDRSWPRPVGHDLGGRVPLVVSTYPLWAPLLALLSLVAPAVGGSVEDVGAMVMLGVTALGTAAMVVRGWFVVFGPVALLAPGVSTALALGGRDYLPGWVVTAQIAVLVVATLSVLAGVVVALRRRRSRVPG